MEYTYITKGTCSRQITLTLNSENKVEKVAFVGGCHGNLQGISKLIEGMSAEEIISRCEGIRCGFKPTSCPDQLAKALREALASQDK